MLYALASLAAAAGLLAPGRAAAAPIVYTFAGVGTGTINGHATLTFNDGTQPGLVIEDGHWKLDGVPFSLDQISLGGAVGLKGVLVDFERPTPTTWDLKLAGKIVLPPGAEVDASIDVKDGVPISLGVEYKATGEDPGIPIGDTGLFFTDLGLQLTDFTSADIVVQAEVRVGFGEQITFLGKQVRLFSAAGHVKIDRHEFDLDAPSR